jgi:hypothetical protein
LHQRPIRKPPIKEDIRVKLHIRFRFNQATGEVETFEIADQDPPLPESEHNRRHDAYAADIGRVLERYPLVRELLPGTPPCSDAAERTLTRAEPNPERDPEPAAERLAVARSRQ